VAADSDCSNRGVVRSAAHVGEQPGPPGLAPPAGVAVTTLGNAGGRLGEVHAGDPLVGSHDRWRDGAAVLAAFDLGQVPVGHASLAGDAAQRDADALPYSPQRRPV
jgi:hypothetical protein